MIAFVKIMHDLTVYFGKVFVCCCFSRQSRAWPVYFSRIAMIFVKIQYQQVTRILITIFEMHTSYSH